jgi:hypothetical protein
MYITILEAGTCLYREFHCRLQAPGLGGPFTSSKVLQTAPEGKEINTTSDSPKFVNMWLVDIGTLVFAETFEQNIGGPCGLDRREFLYPYIGFPRPHIWSRKLTQTVVGL